MPAPHLMKIGLVLGAAVAASGCVSVKTPDKPIEINLNVKIQQEVLVRLQRDVDQLMRENPDVFPDKPEGPNGERR